MVKGPVDDPKLNPHPPLVNWLHGVWHSILAWIATLDWGDSVDVLLTVACTVFRWDRGEVEALFARAKVLVAQAEETFPEPGSGDTKWDWVKGKLKEAGAILAPIAMNLVLELAVNWLKGQAGPKAKAVK